MSEFHIFTYDSGWDRAMQNITLKVPLEECKHLFTQSTLVGKAVAIPSQGKSVENRGS